MKHCCELQCALDTNQEVYDLIKSEITCDQLEILMMQNKVDACNAIRIV